VSETVYEADFKGDEFKNLAEEILSPDQHSVYDKDIARCF
jgi:hypothetical protein